MNITEIIVVPSESPAKHGFKLSLSVDPGYSNVPARVSISISDEDEIGQVIFMSTVEGDAFSEALDRAIERAEEINQQRAEKVAAQGVRF